MTRRILALVTATILGLGILTAPTATADTHCTKIWFTSPTYHGKFQAGQSRCVWLDDKTSGWVNIYSWNDRSKRVIDYTAQFTRTRPNDGRVESVADSVKRLAARHDVRLQFAATDTLGRKGCTDRYPGLTGTYQPPLNMARDHGYGLVRIGTGTTDRCMTNRTWALDLAAHEMSHAIIERRCPEFDDPRGENVTNAYAYRFLGASVRDSGGYGGFTRADSVKAAQIYLNRCAKADGEVSA